MSPAVLPPRPLVSGREDRGPVHLGPTPFWGSPLALGVKGVP